MNATHNTPSHHVLSVEQLYKKCDLSDLNFNTTEDLPELEEIIGQERALTAIDFGMGMNHKGYNLFVLGSEGIGKTALIKKLLKKHYVNRKKTFDWCYVNNFEYPQHPRFLRLPAGTAKPLSETMEKMVKLISTLITVAFQSDEYTAQIQEIETEINDRGDKALNELIDSAKEEQVAVIRTPSGYTLSAIVDGKISNLDSFKQLDEDVQKDFNERIDKYQLMLQETLAKVPVWEQEGKEELDKLDKDIVTQLVDSAMEELFKDYNGFDPVINYLTEVKEDIINHLDEFYEQDVHSKETGQKRKHISKTASFHRYLVNVLVDNSESDDMPIIFEDNPTYSNLIGRIEHLAYYNTREEDQNKTDNAIGLGNLLTAFTLIKPGSLHKANDGYLLLDAEKILVNPYAWEGLKRALKSSSITIEPLDELHSFSRNLTLEPDPIPLRIKIVLIGDRHIYHLLKQNDSEFNKLFKVNVDFSEEMSRSENMTHKYARLIANLQRQEKVSPIERTAVERIIEQSSRLVDHGEKISLHMGDLRDLILEAEYYYRQRQLKHSDSTSSNKTMTNTINLDDVNSAIEARIHRMDQYRDSLYEEIIRGTVLIDTDNQKIGQVNALSVLQIGEFAFGQPSRITATVRIGDGHIVDIEREVDLGGDIHSKGVMILSSYLGHHYAKTKLLSLDANLTFEQSYGEVDGDSASVAELCALLSAVSEIPVKQSMALTGSVNQLGEVQAIGGVNEKVEGFFDICNRRGLTGKQGVLIPKSNVVNLMLKDEVLQAVKNKQFIIHSIEHVDDALSLLMGMEAGVIDELGKYPKNTINYQIQLNLEKYSILKHTEQHKHDKDSDEEE
ncbi:MAG: AAA family ATPase [Gammaproteobacteria bacterium]|nr:AAA family ATPase [Gammaproteobacteria bacterium]